MKVKIYEYSSIKTPKQTDGVGLYVLESEKDGKEITLSGGIRIEKASDKLSNLIVNHTAIDRLTIKCTELEIYTDSAWIEAAFSAGWLEKWKKSGWKNAQGKDLAHAEHWKEIDRKLTELSLIPTFHVGEHHAYSGWLEAEAKRWMEK